MALFTWTLSPPRPHNGWHFYSAFLSKMQTQSAYNVPFIHTMGGRAANIRRQRPQLPGLRWVQCLAQGHFDMPRDHWIIDQPALPTEPPLPN